MRTSLRLTAPENPEAVQTHGAARFVTRGSFLLVHLEKNTMTLSPGTGLGV